MVIDCILDRKDNDSLLAQGYTHRRDFNGKPVSLAYSPDKFYRDICGYAGYMGPTVSYIVECMDYKTEPEVKHALCCYVIQNGYSPEICNYINSVNWLE